jgi:hypothetical protein
MERKRRNERKEAMNGKETLSWNERKDTMNGKKKLKAITAKISLVRPVRGCCLSTGYALVPLQGRKHFFFRILSLLPWVLVNFWFVPFFSWMLVNSSVFTTVYRLCIANPWHCFTRFPALLVRSVSCFSAEGERWIFIVVSLNAFVIIIQVGNLLDHGQQWTIWNEGKQ